jgi:hypothetical protein
MWLGRICGTADIEGARPPQAAGNRRGGCKMYVLTIAPLVTGSATAGGCVAAICYKSLPHWGGTLLAAGAVCTLLLGVFACVKAGTPREEDRDIELDDVPASRSAPSSPVTNYATVMASPGGQSLSLSHSLSSRPEENGAGD